MSFAHKTGTTDPEAPDEIVDWFATFETWITGIGWTVESGSGTTNLFLSSGGEAGGLTMLYVHIWRDAVNVNRVHLEVCDDAVPTHETTRGGYVDSGGVQFVYFMSADKDAIVLVFKAGGGYRMVYGGLVYPFALTVPDETYHLICASNTLEATILRRFDDLWDQDDTLFYNNSICGTVPDPDDGSFALGGVYFGDHADIAGQLKHVSCRIGYAGINPEDKITTGQPGATTEWVILQDDYPRKFALRTGGVLPTGTGDGTFAHVSGTADNLGEFFTAIRNFVVGRGWSATDISGQTGYEHDWEYHSDGEDGTDDIWVRHYAYGVPNVAIFLRVADSAYGTSGRHEASQEATGADDSDFPTQYYISGDKDCFIYTVNAGGVHEPAWAGRISVCAPNLSSPYMKVGQVIRHNSGHILLDHQGAWNGYMACASQYGDYGHCSNCNPNNYDGTTYIVWPHLADRMGGAGEALGGFKYYFATHGNVALLDTITVGARVYKVFVYNQPSDIVWAMRTA